MADFDYLSGAWDTISDMCQNFASFEGAAAVCVGVGLFLFLILGMMNKNYNMWSIIGGAVVGFALFALVSNFTGLYDWIKLGFEWTNPAASIFALGVVWAMFVAAYNLIVTRGSTAVR